MVELKPPFPLRESHAHLLAHGRERSYLNLSDCVDVAECLARVAREASRLAGSGEAGSGEAGWVLGSGLRVQGWAEPRWPTLAELDRVCAGRPVLLCGFDHHSGVVNSAALAASGLSTESADPPGGVLGRDARGRANGLVLESAFNAARRAVPEPTRAQWLGFLRAALEDLAGHGFVEVDDLLAPPMLGELLAELDRAGELTMRVRLYCPLEELEGEIARARGYSSPRVSLAGAKLFADGTLNARTAWMLEPYADPIAEHPCGTALLTSEAMGAAAARCLRAGLGLAVHAIGDGAVRATLDAFEGALRSYGGARADRSELRVEHAELIHPDDVARFAGLGVVCSVQPCHLLYDLEALTRGVPDRLDRVLPLRDLIGSGCDLGGLLRFGSDVPIVRPDPQDSVEGAVHRRRVRRGPAGDVWVGGVNMTQSISVDEVWKGFSAVG